MMIPSPKPKTQQLIIIGSGETAAIAYEYFTHDSSYEVVAFSVEQQFIAHDTLFNLPVMALETLETAYPPKDYHAFVAVSYTQLNRVRTRLYSMVKEKGYYITSYISSRAFVWHNVEIGENCFIFENNVIQPFVKIGNNVVLWSGNHIGHRTVIQDNCYISSHAVISGFCEIGRNSFVGVNSTFADHIKVAEDCLIGAGAVVVKNTETQKIYIGNPAKANEKVTSLRYFKVTEN
jgi:sugar O-acyltransferase (sialic acid O-acetyltransferase NeuD family)